MLPVQPVDMAKAPDSNGPRLTDWESLPVDRQLELKVAFGWYLDALPPTCSLETKIERFRAWLRERGIRHAE
jgi:hypothetical protein